MRSSKMDRKQYYANRDASKVYLFGAFARWRAFKEALNLRSDMDVANMLLDAYYGDMNKLDVW